MIKFRYAPTFKDYLALNRLVVFGRLRSLMVIAAVLCVLFLVQPFVNIGSDHDRGVWEVYRSSLALLILPGLVGVLVGVTFVAARKRWKTAEELRVEREYEIDETGVRVNSPTVAGFLDWRHIVEAKQQGGYFLLRTAQFQYYYFPAAVVPDRRELVRLIAGKVAGTKTRPPSARRWLIFWIWLAIVAAIVALYFLNPTPS